MDRIARLLWAVAAMNVRGWWNEVRRGFAKDPVPLVLSFVLMAGSLLFSLVVGAVLTSAVALDGGEREATRWIVTGLAGSLTIFGVMSGVAEAQADVADAKRLQVYPLHRRELVLLDLVGGALSPMMAFFLPSAAGTALGCFVLALRAGDPVEAIAAPLAVLAAIVVAVAIVRIVGTRVALGGRRMREITGVVVGGLVVSVVLVGPLLEDFMERGGSRVVEIGTRFLAFTHAGAAGGIASGAGTIRDWAVLLLWVAGSIALHRRFALRVLDGEGGIHGARRGKKAARRALPFPRLLPAPALGVFVADLRTLSRMPAMWMLLILPAIFGVLFGRPTHAAGDSASAEMQGAWLPTLAAIGASLLISAQLFSNMFGPDHGGTALYVLSPARPWHLLLGKTVSRFAIGTAQITIFLAALDLRTGRVFERSELYLAAGAWAASALWIAAAGNVTTVRLPFRMSHGAHRERSAFQAGAFLAQFAMMFLLIPPTMMIAGGRALAGSDGYLAGIAATAAGGLVLWIASAIWAGWIFEDRAPEIVEELSK